MHAIYTRNTPRGLSAACAVELCLLNLSFGCNCEYRQTTVSSSLQYYTTTTTDSTRTLAHASRCNRLCCRVAEEYAPDYLPAPCLLGLGHGRGHVYNTTADPRVITRGVGSSGQERSNLGSHLRDARWDSAGKASCFGTCSVFKFSSKEINSCRVALLARPPHEVRVQLARLLWVQG